MTHKNFTPYLGYPGKSFVLKFIPNQSEFISTSSETIRVNPRLRIRMIPDLFFNPDESEVGIIRIDSD